LSESPLKEDSKYNKAPLETAMLLTERQDVDVKKWDETILNSKFPLVFAQAFYLDATSPGWKALIASAYKTVMPLTAKKKYGFNYVIQPPFTSQLGVFGDTKEETVREFLAELDKRYRYIDIELNASNNLITERTKNKRTFVLHGNAPLNFNSNTKRNIAKAEKAGLAVHNLPDTEALNASKKLVNPFLRNTLKIKPAHIRQFEQLLENSMKVNYLTTFAVKNNKGDICAVSHFISNGKHALYLKGANNDKNSGSMHLLMGHAIEYYRQQKVGLFDFGGGQSESLATFYRGFGAVQLDYKVYKKNTLPAPLKLIKR
jgi:hypothetical protein